MRSLIYSRRTYGFTLVEILVTISIIGVLASVILPQLNVARDKAEVAKALVELKALQDATTILVGDTNKYPNNQDEFCRPGPLSGNEVDLSSDNAGLLANGLGWSNWNGPYISAATDPWGGAYYLDEDYQCLAATEGCQGVTDPGNDSSVLVSCGPNQALADGACAYDDDNIVVKLCD